MVSLHECISVCFNVRMLHISISASQQHANMKDIFDTTLWPPPPIPILQFNVIVPLGESMLTLGYPSNFAACFQETISPTHFYWNKYSTTQDIIHQTCFKSVPVWRKKSTPSTGISFSRLFWNNIRNRFKGTFSPDFLTQIFICIKHLPLSADSRPKILAKMVANLLR